MNKYESLFAERGLSLERLRTLCLVDEAGSLSAAAGGDPSKLSLYSRQLKELEGFCGCPLARKTGRVLHLKEAGRRLAAMARAHFNDLDSFVRASRTQPPDLYIGAPNSIAAWVLMPRLVQLREATGGARLTVWTMLTADTIARIENGGLHLGIVREDAIPPGLLRRPLFTIRYALFLPDSWAARVSPATLKVQMKDIPLATSMGGRFREDLERAADDARWKMNIVLSCSTFFHAAQALATGAVGAVLPTLVTHETMPGRWTAFPLPFLKDYRQPMCLVSRMESPAVKAVGRVLRGTT